MARKPRSWVCNAALAALNIGVGYAWQTAVLALTLFPALVRAMRNREPSEFEEFLADCLRLMLIVGFTLADGAAWVWQRIKRTK